MFFEAPQIAPVNSTPSAPVTKRRRFNSVGNNPESVGPSRVPSEAVAGSATSTPVPRAVARPVKLFRRATVSESDVSRNAGWPLTENRAASSTIFEARTGFNFNESAFGHSSTLNTSVGTSPMSSINSTNTTDVSTAVKFDSFRPVLKVAQNYVTRRVYHNLITYSCLAGSSIFFKSGKGHDPP
jgi:hypothetical protein